MVSKVRYWLLLIFLLTLAARLFFAFSIPTFTYESYFHLRQVEHISQTGLPLYQDPLSYGGRDHAFLPFFHYVMAFFNLFLPLDLVARIIPNILLASITIMVFLITKKITEDETASLMAAFTAGFLPALFTTNSFTVDALFIPLVFLTIYAFLHLNDNKYLLLYIFSFLLLSLTTPATFLLLMGFGIYLLLSYAEGKKMQKAEMEIILFSVFFFVWTQFLFFKDVLLGEGIKFIQQNIPPQIVSVYFPSISVPQALVLVSIVPFVVGIYTIYRSVFQLKNQKSFLLISLAISTALLAWYQLIQFKVSLAFFSVILAILFGSFYTETNNYVRKTKFHRYQKYFAPITVLILALSLILPATAAALSQDVPTMEEITALQWIKDNTPQNTSVLGLLEEGHLITYFAERKNLMDPQFPLIEDVENRFQDLNTLYTTPFQTEALGILNRYNLNYLLITPHAKDKYDLFLPRYLGASCFKRLYKNESRVYEVTCTIDKKENKPQNETEI